MLKYKIAISGKANSGKNTVANLLGSNLSEYYKILAFADPIKEMVLNMFPEADSNCLYGPSQLRSNQIPNAFKNGSSPLTYRQCLIDLGELGRSYNQNIWVNKLNDKIYKNSFISEGFQTVIVSDLRQLNEFNYLKDKGFFIIRLNRDLSLKLDHKTETNLDDMESSFDYLLNNNGTLDDLRKEIQVIIEKIKKQ